jgi:hypothetical protein
MLSFQGGVAFGGGQPAAGVVGASTIFSFFFLACISSAFQRMRHITTKVRQADCAADLSKKIIGRPAGVPQQAVAGASGVGGPAGVTGYGMRTQKQKQRKQRKPNAQRIRIRACMCMRA